MAKGYIINNLEEDTGKLKQLKEPKRVKKGFVIVAEEFEEFSSNSESDSGVK